MKNIFTKREKSIFFAIIAFLIFLMLFNFIALPLLEKNSELNKRIRDRRTKLETYLQLLSQKDFIEKRARELSLDFTTDTFREEGPLAAMSILQGLTRSADVKIIEIRPQTVSKAVSASQALAIDLKTEGDIQGYLLFVYTLENSPFLLKIKKLQLTAKPNSSYLEGIFVITQPPLSE